MSVRVSVAMAVYNGEKYLREQLSSIQRQLGSDDEIVISVDPSGDGSKALALEMAMNDKRIHVIDGPGQGAIKNFEAALRAASGDIVFLADQDDVWMEGKVACCLQSLDKEKVTAVLHDAIVTDESLLKMRDSFFEGSYKPGVFNNIKRNRYIGCCMAFKREVIELALPFPKGLPMHDQWLGLLAEKLGDISYIDSPQILYRRHEQTVTGRQKSSLAQKTVWRWNIAISYILRSFRHGTH